MQLMLILGIVFAIGAVLFALQNNVAITVAFAVWQFEGSQALVLLLTLGLGVLIAGLVSSPTIIRRQWEAARMRRQIADLERQVAGLQRGEAELAARLQQLSPNSVSEPVSEQKPYVGLRSLIGGAGAGSGEKSPANVPANQPTAGDATR